MSKEDLTEQKDDYDQSNPFIAAINGVSTYRGDVLKLQKTQKNQSDTKDLVAAVGMVNAAIIAEIKKACEVKEDSNPNKITVVLNLFSVFASPGNMTLNQSQAGMFALFNDHRVDYFNNIVEIMKHHGLLLKPVRRYAIREFKAHFEVYTGLGTTTSFDEFDLTKDDAYNISAKLLGKRFDDADEVTVEEISPQANPKSEIGNGEKPTPTNPPAETVLASSQGNNGTTSAQPVQEIPGKGFNFPKAASVIPDAKKNQVS